ncbi:MAG: hypothetical protein EBV06_02330 [Planctomycetia bacterium]|nr:hypothetical protein [Planctomycetia bacterium]
MEVIQWPGTRRTSDPEASATASSAGRLIRHVRQALHQGATIGFPSSNGYIAVTEAAYAGRLAGRLEVLVSGIGAALDWAPQLGYAGRRLAERVWPGPLVLIATEGVSQGLAARLDIRDRLLEGGEIRLRAADHASLQAVLQRADGPIFGVPLTEPVGVDLLLSTGRSVVAKPTVVHVNGDRWQIREAGTLDETSIARRLARSIVFVCTGNTCRSPLAETLCKKRLAEKLDCTPSELPLRGWMVASAGLAASPGLPAATEAIAVAQVRGADLSAHESQPLDERITSTADCLLVMTRSHLRALRTAGLGPITRLIHPDGHDIDDPFGSEHEVYEQCAAQIDSCLQRLVDEWLRRRP